MFYKIKFKIGEWKSGIFVQAVFDEKRISDCFKSHLKGLHELHDGAPTVVDKICKKLYKCMM